MLRSLGLGVETSLLRPLTHDGQCGTLITSGGPDHLTVLLESGVLLGPFHGKVPLMLRG